MNYTEDFEGVKIDVQAGDITVSDDLQQEIRDAVGRLKRHVSEVNSVDVYFTDKSEKSTDTKNVGIRFGIPGSDAYASDSGDSWMELLRNVEEKLRRQLNKG
ncbi:MAG: HPF/RaiA family ribosome-associated protein [Bacteroidales bacterium]|nr:HPF/RaiA family ribosome-associated protein [Bacteroidales bacterium]MDD4673798.1 HPF/RaiA family ribosome-associated protein [Bacteroidales bacterium]MDY0349211.1 HPF/RaiA family ribosome-associated protein [Tenuifilaceae bacterium]